MSAANSSHLVAADSELPGGWAFAKLGDICTPPQYGWTTSANKDKRGLKLLRTTDISNGEVDWASVPGCEDEPDDSEKYLLDSGDILISRAGSVGLSYLVGNCPRAVFASYLIRFRPIPPIEPAYVALFLKSPSYWSAIAEEAAGIAVPNVNASKLKEIDVSVPPLAEQKRIVEKVEQLLLRLDTARNRLARVPLILKRFRQTVLAAACSGRLTADWRERHYGRPLELPATIAWDENGVAEFELPKTWRESSVALACTAIVDCPHSTPKWTNSGVICLRTTNFRAGSLDLSDVRYVSESTYEERTERLKPCEGDVLYSREGGILGLACLVPPATRLCLGQRMMLMRANEQILNPVFLMHVLNCPQTTQRVQRLTGGSSSPHLNVQEIKRFPVPIPPPSEQSEVVRRVEALFSLADAIEKRVAAASLRADKLTQAILAKAFRGELVPTEAELARREGRPYESASALLARIGAESAGNGSRPKSLRNRKR